MERYVTISADCHAGRDSPAVMDRRYSLEHGTKKLGTGYRKAMSMKPSESFHHSAMIGGSGMNRDEAEMLGEIERVFGTNAAEFYGFYTEKLLPLAERIGPERSWFRDETARK
jgi:hypothetical protein